MMDYYLAIIIALLILFSGFVAYKIPIIGFVAMFLGSLLLIPLAINPTVIMNSGFDASYNPIFVTKEILELRALSIFSMFICIAGTILGVEKNL